VYGFGSFFRQQGFRDIDLAVVIDSTGMESVEHFYRFASGFSALEQHLGVRFDFSFFTVSEFSRRPLRDMDQLYMLYGRQ